MSILKAMLKAEVEGIGIPTQGVPQGGILSPLLSNIVLNELDWWISSQCCLYRYAIACSVPLFGLNPKL